MTKKRRWHVTEKEKNEIRRLTLAGVRQIVIARTLKITAPRVSAAQRAMGLPTCLVTPEAEIMRLFRAGVGGYEISRRLHCPANRVWAVMHKNGFQRADKFGIWTPQENIDRFTEALRRREDYVVRLAKKYNVGLCKANRIAHQILGTYRFRPGQAKPPLSSDFPQKHHDTEDTLDSLAAELAERIAVEIFGGVLPSGSASKVANAVAKVSLPADVPAPVRGRFLESLTGALEARSIAQNQWPN